MIDRTEKRIVPSFSDAGIYASRKGEIYALRDGKFVHRKATNAGRVYMRVSARKNGEKTSRLHTRSQMVAEAFLGPLPTGHQVDHKRNHEKTNDSVRNLQYLPAKAVTKTDISNARKDASRRIAQPVMALKIKGRNAKPRLFPSISACAQAIGRDSKTVLNTVNGLQRSCGGYVLLKA